MDLKDEACQICVMGPKGHNGCPHGGSSTDGIFCRIAKDEVKEKKDASSKGR